MEVLTNTKKGRVLLKNYNLHLAALPVIDQEAVQETKKYNKHFYKLFNYIKRHPSMRVSLFHGTSTKIWEQIQKDGYFSSPKIRNAQDRERRKDGLEEVFFTTNIEYSYFYAVRSSSQHQADPIILHLEIPLYWIKEIVNVIFDPKNINKIYNEYQIPDQINNILYNFLPGNSIEEQANKLLDFFIDKYIKKDRDEFTIKHIVPVRFVKNTTKTNSKFLEQVVNEIIENKIKFSYIEDQELQKIIKLFPKDDSNKNLDFLRNKVNKIKSIEEVKKSIRDESNYHYDNEKESINAYNNSLNYIYDIFTSHNLDNTEKQEIIKVFLSSMHNRLFGLSDVKSNDFFDALINDLENKNSIFNDIANYYPIFKQEVFYFIKNTFNESYDALSLAKQNIENKLKSEDNPNTKYELYILTQNSRNFYFNVREAIKTFNTHFDFINKLNIISDFNNKMKEINDATRFLYLAYIKYDAEMPLSAQHKNYYLPQETYKIFNDYIDFDQQNIENDPEAKNLANKSARKMYLKNLESLQHYSYFTELQKYYKQEIPIEKDFEAQKSYMKGWAERSKRNHSRRTRFIAQDSDKQKAIIKTEEIKNLPKWALNNKYWKEFIKNYIQENYYNYYVTDGIYIDESSFPEEYRTESGYDNYEKRAIINILKNNTSALPSFEYVQTNYPELVDSYKNKVKNLINEFITSASKEKNSHLQMTLIAETLRLCKLIKLKDFEPQIENFAKSVLMNKIQEANNIAKTDQKNALQYINHDLLQIIKNLFSQGRYNNLIKIKINDLSEELQNVIKLAFYNIVKNQSNLQTIMSSFVYGAYGSYIKIVNNNQVDSFAIMLYAEMEKVFCDKIQEIANNTNSASVLRSEVLTQIDYVLERFRKEQNEFYDLSLQRKIISRTLVEPLKRAFSSDDKTIFNIFEYMKYNIKDIMVYINSDSLASQKIVTEYKKLLNEEKLNINQSINPISNEKNDNNQIINNKQETNKISFSRKNNKWYEGYKIGQQSFNDINKDEAYEVFRDSYQKATGNAWNKEKFFRRANQWRFYGSSKGYIAVREQNSGMLKLTGIAGSLKEILKGLESLKQENVPVWGAVSKEIKDMAIRSGFSIVPKQTVEKLINIVPKNVFGDAEIQEVYSDGAVDFLYKDIGLVKKYLIGNSLYLSFLQSFGS